MSIEHVDVLIVGAGLSGISAGRHLQLKCPGRTFAILEAREAIGGTWDLFRYPGIRSDSDMSTLGYSFEPWTGSKALADGTSILDYVRGTARKYGVDQHIRYQQRVVRASWSSADSRWLIDAERGPNKELVRYSANFLHFCSGYYNYEQGYTPDFPGRERFKGRVVHPQKWTPDIDYKGKRVVVIGSGATAVTLVPSMADEAAHVTMLQRSPTYIMSLPAQDAIANGLRRVLPDKIAYGLTRWKNVLLAMVFYKLSRSRPHWIKNMIRRGVKAALGKHYESRHFTPSYNPWDQRVCFVPDGDLFRAMRKGKASIVTDHIETFTEKGIKLKSGAELEADLVVSATGLNLLALGGTQLSVDGRPVDLSKTLSYKGMMLSGVPNMAVALGYTNASWTLKCDLVCEYVCRLLNHMQATGQTQCVARNNDPTITEEPFIDFSSGYVQRSVHLFPRQGSRAPWKLYQNYVRDLLMIRYSAVDDGAMQFSAAAPEAGATLAAAAK